MSGLKKLNELCNQLSVLYVEDDLEAQDGVSTTLRRIFKEVYTAENGTIGLELFNEYHPDIVITDIQMPYCNGIEMSKAIKATSPKTPIIITTAFNEEDYLLQAIENDIDSFVLKPIDKEKLIYALLKNINRICDEKKARELEKRQKIDEINQFSEESVQELANLLPFPTLFYKDNKLIFINTIAAKMLEEVQIESINQETAFVSQFAITKDKRQKIKLPTMDGSIKVYWLYFNGFFIGIDYTLVQTYIFIDIPNTTEIRENT